MNPRFPCPCTFAQARVDRRFAQLFSENYYERLQSLVCYGPMTRTWVRVNGVVRFLRSQVNTSTTSKARVTIILVLLDMLLQSTVGKSGYVQFSGWVSPIRPNYCPSTISVAKTNPILVCLFSSLFASFASSIFIVAINAAFHRTRQEPLIGAPVNSTTNFIQQARVQDIDLRLSVRTTAVSGSMLIIVINYF